MKFVKKKAAAAAAASAKAVDIEEATPVKSHRNKLTMVSAQYDLDGDGVLDAAELAMRERDLSNRGYLTNEEIYGIVTDQLSAEKDAHRYKKAIAGLVCFIFILAVSNLGTSFASALLAKEMTADAASATMTNAATGELMAVQTAGDTYDIQELPDDLYERRRQLVFDALERDPHHTSHAHRRMKKCKKAEKFADDEDGRYTCDGKILLDNSFIPESQFRTLTDKCENKKTVNIRRRYDDGFTRSDCLCNGESSVVVKTKKVKTSKDASSNTSVEVVSVKGPRKDKTKTKDRGAREVIIVTGENKVHWDCDGDYCYGSGDLLLSQEGESCSPRKNDCVDDLICIPDTTKSKKNKRNSSSSSSTGICATPNVLKIKVKSTTIKRYQRSNKQCNVAYGRDACISGYYCHTEDAYDANGICTPEKEATIKVSKVIKRRVGDGELCNVSYGNSACDSGLYCSVSDTFANTGICVVDVRTIYDCRSVGDTCDTAFGEDACGPGLYCLVTETRAADNGGGVGAAAAGTGGMIAGPSGTITWGNYGATGMDARAGGGTGAAAGTGGVISGPSGTITWGNYGATAGVARTTGVCARLT